MSTDLTLQEAARRAFVSVETIKYWIKTGVLSTVPGPASKGSGGPRGKRIPLAELESSTPEARQRRMKEQHPGNLMTVSEIARAINITKTLAYTLVRRYGPKKYYYQGRFYLLDGEELADFISEDPTYYHLIKKPIPATLL